MTERQQAIKDIKEYLKGVGKSFLQFRTDLNPEMRELVDEQLKAQKEKAEKKASFSGFVYSSKKE